MTAPKEAVFITPDEAKAAIDAAAFTDDEGRRTVHSYLGMMGADWDVRLIHEAIEKAVVVDGVPQIGWMYHWCKHELALYTADDPGCPPRFLRFDVQMPDSGEGIPTV